MKVIRIRTCFDCTYLEMRSDSDVCILLNRMLETKKIPDWCPLEDASIPQRSWGWAEVQMGGGNDKA